MGQNTERQVFGIGAKGDWQYAAGLVFIFYLKHDCTVSFKIQQIENFLNPPSPRAGEGRGEGDKLPLPGEGSLKAEALPVGNRIFSIC
jgi:hypothetical protein